MHGNDNDGALAALRELVEKAEKGEHVVVLAMDQKTCFFAQANPPEQVNPQAVAMDIMCLGAALGRFVGGYVIQEDEPLSQSALCVAALTGFTQGVKTRVGDKALALMDPPTDTVN